MGKPEDAASDVDCVQCFKRGGAEERRRAFCALYDRHAGIVRNYLLRLTGCPDLSDDLTQETFLHAFRGLDRFDGEAAFRTWTFRIAINLFRDHLRARKPAGEHAMPEDIP